MIRVLVPPLLGVAYLIVAFISGEAEEVILTMLFVGFSLALIYFGDGFGGRTGILFRGPAITKKSPGVMVSFMGWLFILFPVVLGLGFLLFGS